jgi:flagellar basal-body rod protein FlgF
LEDDLDNQGYITISRQMGLMREMQVVANNIANSATNGFRQEGIIFSEYVEAVEGAASISMGQGNVGKTSFEQGPLTETGGTFDFAIEGDGFFLVQTPAGERLTRAGAFSTSAEGDLVNMDGFPVLDAGGAPVFIPPDAQSVSVSSDGTLGVDGQLLGQIGIVVPNDPTDMVREDGVMFKTDGGFIEAENARIVQGFVENSNVNPILQIARMVEVQRAYELGQSFLNSEDERVREAISTLVKQSR